MSDSKTYECGKHHSTQERGNPCPSCVEAFATRRDAATMTGEERAAECRWWGTKVTIPWGDLHQRFEELVGRPIWTHEFADAGTLIEEARTGAHPTFSETLDKLPESVRGKTIVVVTD